MYQEAASDVQQLVQLYSVGKKKKIKQKNQEKTYKSSDIRNAVDRSWRDYSPSDEWTISFLISKIE